MQSSFKIAVVAVAALFAADAIACGDSMYRVGKGVSYRVYTAPLPGSVLVYGQSEGARLLAEALAQSGHGVRYVESEADLQSELSSGAYDVVIASYDDHDKVEASGSSTTYLPVAGTRDQAEAAESRYEEVMVADRDEIKHYLKAIHNTLKSRS
jgi:ABC-type amino acid transport substrate-binding protein